MKPENDIEQIVRETRAETNPQTDEQILTAAQAALESVAPTQQNIWRMIMKSPITKFAAAAVIVIAVLIAVNHFSGSIDGSGVAWAELVQRVEQSHDEYMKELLSAMEEKDTERVNFYSHLLEEFWQKLGWMARAKIEPEFQIHMLTMIADQKARYNERGPSAQAGIRLFLEHEEQFSNWLDKIDDKAWINETAHVCKQLEEYGEEIRDVAWDSELTFSYVEHCMPSFVVYCEWFDQLPWDNPEQYMTPAMHLTGIGRDLNIARHEVETLQIRGVARFVKRCVQQVQKNVLDLDKKIASSRTKRQRELCRQLSRRIDELCALIIYAEIASQDHLEEIFSQGKFKRGQRYDQVLTAEFGDKGPFADYYIERIDQSLDLCRQLFEELELIQ
ncbi:MAG TPA: hypothetical protein HPP87_05225 [Planctomycetes bacterium]|nr:hypothetical protein [Planctomycetota bacterium]